MSRVFNDGTDRVVLTAHAAIDNLATFSASIWTYRTGVGGGGTGNARLLQKGVGGGQREFEWYGNNTSSVSTFTVTRWNTTPGQWHWILPTLNTWEHFLVTYDTGSTSNNPVAYKNGVSTTVTKDTTPAGTLATTTTADLVIGNDPAGIRGYVGRHMHVAYWNRILSAGEAMAVYCVGPRVCPQGRVACLPLFGQASPEPNYAGAGGTAAVTGTTVGPNNIPKMPAFWA